MKQFESCCWEAHVPQVNGSSAQRCRIPAPLFRNESITLSLFFSVVPGLVLCRPLALRARQDFPVEEQEQGREQRVDGYRIIRLEKTLKMIEFDS